MDVLACRKYTAGGEEKTAFTKVGAAFPNRDGKGWSISLDCIPAPEVGQNGAMQYRLLMREPLPQDGQGAQAPARGRAAHGAAARGAPVFDAGDDDIPF